MKIMLGDIEIGSIPKEWEVVRLQNVIKELRNGFASGKRDDNGIVQIRMNNVTTDGHLTLNSFLKVPISENISEFLLRENDFLFNNTNSIDLVGKSAIFKKAPFPCTFSNHFTRIRFNNAVLPEWVLFNFITLWKTGYFKSVAIRHVGQSAVQTKYLTNIRIPLPPLPEQKKIAEILSTVDQAIEKVSEAIEKTQRLEKGLMQELLTKGIGHKEFKDTDVGRIPKKWEVVKLAKIVTYEKGRKPKVLLDQREENTFPYLSAETLRTGNFTQWARKIGEVIKVERDEVILIWDGFYCGDSFIGFEGILSSTMIKIEPKNQNLDKHFLFYFLKACFKELNTKISGMYLKHVNKFIFESQKLPLPLLPEQQKIAEILGAVDKRLELIRKRKERLGKIRKGLMNDLLTGRKRVKLN